MAVFVPNSTFTSAVVTNLSRVKKVPFQRKIAISKNYLQKMDNILEDIRRKLESHPMIDSTITPSIYVSEITDSYVEIEIRCTLRNSVSIHNLCYLFLSHYFSLEWMRNGLASVFL